MSEITKLHTSMKITPSSTGINQRVLNEISALAQKYNIRQVILFGSRARGDFSPTSDIDLAVSGGNIARFSLDLDEETSTLLKYDIVDLERAITARITRVYKKGGENTL